MALKKERSSNKKTGLCKLVINEDLTIYVIDELKKRLSKEIESYTDFKLTLSDIEEIDSAGIQLLLAFKNELAGKSKTLTLQQGVSEAVSKLMAIYGVNDQFQWEASS